MKWNKETLEEFLDDKQKKSLHINEYLLLIDFIRKIKPDTIVDVGTYLGASGYILGTCCDSIKYIYSIENTDTPEYYPKPEATKEEHGKYLTDDTIFLTKGYMTRDFYNIMKEHPDAFVFWDAGKATEKVLGQLKLSYRLKIKYIAFHDTGIGFREENPRPTHKALDIAIENRWYKIICEDLESSPKK